MEELQSTRCLISKKIELLKQFRKIILLFRQQNSNNIRPIVFHPLFTNNFFAMIADWLCSSSNNFDSNSNSVHNPNNPLFEQASDFCLTLLSERENDEQTISTTINNFLSQFYLVSRSTGWRQQISLLQWLGKLIATHNNVIVPILIKQHSSFLEHLLSAISFPIDQVKSMIIFILVCVIRNPISTEWLFNNNDICSIIFQSTLSLLTQQSDQILRTNSFALLRLFCGIPKTSAFVINKVVEIDSLKKKQQAKESNSSLSFMLCEAIKSSLLSVDIDIQLIGIEILDSLLVHSKSMKNVLNFETQLLMIFKDSDLFLFLDQLLATSIESNKEVCQSILKLYGNHPSILKSNRNSFGMIEVLSRISSLKSTNGFELKIVEKILELLCESLISNSKSEMKEKERENNNKQITFPIASLEQDKLCETLTKLLKAFGSQRLIPLVCKILIFWIQNQELGVKPINSNLLFDIIVNENHLSCVLKLLEIHMHTFNNTYFAEMSEKMLNIMIPKLISILNEIGKQQQQSSISQFSTSQFSTTTTSSSSFISQWEESQQYSQQSQPQANSQSTSIQEPTVSVISRFQNQLEFISNFFSTMNAILTLNINNNDKSEFVSKLVEERKIWKCWKRCLTCGVINDQQILNDLNRLAWKIVSISFQIQKQEVPELSLFSFKSGNVENQILEFLETKSQQPQHLNNEMKESNDFTVSEKTLILLFCLVKSNSTDLLSSTKKLKELSQSLEQFISNNSAKKSIINNLNLLLWFVSEVEERQHQSHNNNGTTNHQTMFESRLNRLTIQLLLNPNVNEICLDQISKEPTSTLTSTINSKIMKWLWRQQVLLNWNVEKISNWIDVEKVRGTTPTQFVMEKMQNILTSIERESWKMMLMIIRKELSQNDQNNSSRFEFLIPLLFQSLNGSSEESFNSKDDFVVSGIASSLISRMKNDKTNSFYILLILMRLLEKNFKTYGNSKQLNSNELLKHNHLHQQNPNQKGKISTILKQLFEWLIEKVKQEGESNINIEIEDDLEVFAIQLLNFSNLFLHSNIEFFENQNEDQILETKPEELEFLKKLKFELLEFLEQLICLSPRFQRPSIKIASAQLQIQCSLQNDENEIENINIDDDDENETVSEEEKVDEEVDSQLTVFDGDPTNLLIDQNEQSQKITTNDFIKMQNHQQPQQSLSQNQQSLILKEIAQSSINPEKWLEPNFKASELELTYLSLISKTNPSILEMNEWRFVLQNRMIQFNSNMKLDALTIYANVSKFQNQQFKQWNEEFQRITIIEKERNEKRKLELIERNKEKDDVEMKEIMNDDFEMKENIPIENEAIPEQRTINNNITTINKPSKMPNVSFISMNENPWMKFLIEEMISQNTSSTTNEIQLSIVSEIIDFESTINSSSSIFPLNEFLEQFANNLNSNQSNLNNTIVSEWHFNLLKILEIGIRKNQTNNNLKPSTKIILRRCLEKILESAREIGETERRGKFPQEEIDVEQKIEYVDHVLLIHNVLEKSWQSIEKREEKERNPKINVIDIFSFKERLFRVIQQLN